MHSEPRLDEHLEEMQLGALAGRPAERSQAVVDLASSLEGSVEAGGGKMLIGLHMAFVAMAEEALDAVDESTVPDVLSRFPRQEVGARGQVLNTLNLVLDDGKAVVRLRAHLDRIAHVFRNVLRRYDYPNAGPHTSQAWSSHTSTLRAIFAFAPNERRAFAEEVWKLVVELPEHGRRTIEDAKPRPFEVVLRDFPNTQPREPAGAVLQGLAFAYFRADSPTVTIDTGKVGAGSRRTGRIGDVDGWHGAELALSVEVKDSDLTDPSDPDLGNFIANLSEWPDAVAIVLARSATEAVVEGMRNQNVLVLDRAAMIDAVLRWDLSKQQLATREFLHFLVHVQQHGGLIGRFRTFLASEGIEL
ncbi:MAG TPA: hypothetical protein VF715_01365 [Thermoleophilaceae bacterium]